MVFSKKKQGSKFMTPPAYLDDVSSMGGDSGAGTSVPPPPPPISERINTMDRPNGPPSIIRSHPTAEGLPRQTYLIEDNDSIEAEDISYWPANWDTFFGEETPRGNRRRRACSAMACLLLVCVVMAISFGVSGDKESSDRSNNLSAFQGAQQVVSEIPQPTPAPGDDDALTPAPTQCETFIKPELTCVQPLTGFVIEWSMCTPMYDDWIGIYEISSGINYYNLTDDKMWLWTCNSQQLDDCNEEVTYGGRFLFGGGLPSGNYQAHLVRRNPGGPYISYEASPPFHISESC